MKISTFIIGLLLISLFVGVFMNFFSELNDKYTPAVDYNSSDWEQYNQLTVLKADTLTIKEKTENIKQKTGVLDVIGAYFSSAYDSVKLTINSITSFESIMDVAIEDAGLGENTPIFKDVLVTIVLVLIIIGVLLSAIMKVAL